MLILVHKAVAASETALTVSAVSSRSSRVTYQDIASARRLALSVLPESLRYLVAGSHFEQNLRNMFEGLPDITLRVLRASVHRAGNHRDPQALLGSSVASTVVQYIAARVVIPFALADREHSPGEMFGLFTMTGNDKIDYARTTDLRRYPNLIESPGLEVPNWSLDSIVGGEIDAVVYGSSAGGVATGRLAERFNGRILCLEEGPYYSAQQLAQLSQDRALPRLMRDGATIVAMNASLKYGLSGIPLMMATGVGGTGLVYNGCLEAEPDEDYAAANWPEGLDVHDAYIDYLRARLQIRPIPEDLMSPMSRLLLQTGRRLLDYRPDWFTADDVRAIETAFILQCQGWGRCNAGCPGDNKIHAGNTFLDWALRDHPDRVLLATNQRVLKLEGLTDGHIRAVKVARIDPRTKDVIDVSTVRLSDKGEVYSAAGVTGAPKIFYNSGLRGSVFNPLYTNMHIHPITEILFVLDRQKILEVMAQHPLATKVLAQNGRPQAVVLRVPLPARKGRKQWAYIECALTPPSIMALVSPGLVGQGIKTLLDVHANIGIMGVLLIESDDSYGTVWPVTKRSQVIRYRLAEPDREAMFDMVEMTMRILKEAGVTDMRLNMAGPALPNNASMFADLGFHNADRIDEVMHNVRSGRNPLFLFASHAGQTTTSVVEDFTTGRVRGVDNLYCVSHDSMHDFGGHPSLGMWARTWGRIDNIHR